MEGFVSSLPDKDSKIPKDSPTEQPKCVPMTKRFARLWETIFDQYGVIVDEKDLDHVYCGLRSYYENKIKETYDRDFRWKECCKNNFTLREKAGDCVRLPELVTSMKKEGLVPGLTFHDKWGYIIKHINEGGGAKVKLLRTLWDVKEDAGLLKVILDVPVSLHSRKPIPLRELCGDSPKVLKTIKLVDIIQRISENDSYVNIEKTWQRKMPDELLEDEQLTKKCFSTPLEDLYVILGKMGAGKSTLLDRIACLLHQKELIIKCDLMDCVDDFRMDEREIDKNPVQYFYNKFRESGGLDVGGSILEAIYEKQMKDGQVIIVLDSFEQIFDEFARKLIGLLEKMKEAQVISVLVTIDPRNELLLWRKFPYLNPLYVKDLNREDIRDYLKINGVTLVKGCEEKFLNNPLYLSMVKDIYTEDLMNKNRLTKITDIYSEYIKHCMAAKGKSIVLLTHMALMYIFPEKHVNVGVNFRQEFPHRAIAEYLVATWICNPKNSNGVEVFIPVVLRSYKYNQVYKFLIEILRSDLQSSKTPNQWWGIPPLIWGISSCVHSHGKELKQAIHSVEEMAIKMGADAFENTLSNSPFVHLNTFRFQHGHRFLHLVSRYGNKNLMKILFEISSKNINKPLCLNDHTQITRYLLNYTVHPNMPDENGDTPLHVACQKAKSAEIVKILLENKADPNLEDRDSYTSLHIAVISNENLEIVHNLLEHNADPNTYTMWGSTVLHLACQNGSSELIKLLIDHGGNPNIQNKIKWNCLHIAWFHNNIQAASLLSDLVDSNTLDNNKKPPLYIACYHQNETMLRTLLSNGNFNVNALVDNSYTILHYTCYNGPVSIVKILLEAGADPNVQSCSGKTPLHWACCSSIIDIVRVLVRAGADITVKTPDGESCIDMARSIRFTSAVNFLLSCAEKMREYKMSKTCATNLSCEQKAVYKQYSTKAEKH